MGPTTCDPMQGRQPKKNIASFTPTKVREYCLIYPHKNVKERVYCLNAITFDE
jgi:hypothetical protein